MAWGQESKESLISPGKRNSEIRDYLLRQRTGEGAAGIAVGAALTQHLPPVTAA